MHSNPRFFEPGNSVLEGGDDLDDSQDDERSTGGNAEQAKTETKETVRRGHQHCTVCAVPD